MDMKDLDDPGSYRARTSNESASKPYGDPDGTVVIPRATSVVDQPSRQVEGEVAARHVKTEKVEISGIRSLGDLFKEMETKKPQFGGMMNGPVGSGVPNQYPLVINTPLDRAYLRPLQQPLFDTEWFLPGKGIKQLEFFSRAIEHKYQYLEEIKTRHDTNLVLNNQLTYPREHSILGFRATLDSRTSQEDRDALLSSGALVEFTFGGNRSYLTVPFFDICAPRKDEKSVGEILAARELGLSATTLLHPANFNPKPEPTAKDDNRRLIDYAVKLLEKAGSGNKQKYYPFNLGRSALKIKPDEAFKMTLSWKKTPQVLKPVRIVMEIVGLLWQPL